jgi:nicotinamidase-related amidase
MNNSSEMFLRYLADWQQGLSALPLMEAAPSPDRAAVFSVDLINGFCTEGVLSSPRVQAIVGPVRDLFLRAWEYGIRDLVLLQDTHEPDAVEFSSFAPHCVRGTSESQTVPELVSLPFFDRMTVIEKNSIHSGMNTSFHSWLESHPDVEDCIVVGDCTDLCTYQLAMELRLQANAAQIKRRVIVPANCVQTYDMPVDVAKNIGVFPHDGDLMHTIFLYHMALNGVEVVKEILP